MWHSVERLLDMLGVWEHQLQASHVMLQWHAALVLRSPCALDRAWCV